MASEQRKRTRSERVAALELPPGKFARIVAQLRQGSVLVRIGLCAAAAIALWAVTTAWAPPFEFRTGQVPRRDIVARTDFEIEDPQKTNDARGLARRLAMAVYQQDSVELSQLQASLQLDVDQVIQAESFDTLDASVWARFEPPRDDKTPAPTAEQRRQAFRQFRTLLTADGVLDQFKAAVDEALKPFKQRGLLDELPKDFPGNKEEIQVYPKERTESSANDLPKGGFPQVVRISDVLISSASPALKKALTEELKSMEIANRIYAWLQPQLPTTLKFDAKETEKDRDEAVKAVEPEMKPYAAGDLLVVARDAKPLGEPDIKLLWAEYQAALAARGLVAKVSRSLAALGMFVALCLLCGFYIRRRSPALINNLSQFVTFLCLVVLTVGLSRLMARDDWQAEMIPLLLFAMTVTIVYHQELALLLTAAVTLLIATAVGDGLPAAVILMAVASGTILSLGRVRTRSKLLVVGLIGAAVALLTTLGIGTLTGHAWSPLLLLQALRFATWAVIAGSLMTCMLPLIERWFGVQTDLSLMELGDPAHPLLQELVRRAPGTYNHSITVASLAEAAAERIGARGLLVRVGAYYHDIGKMLKPGYFIENQGHGDNRHESLVPAMSTLVIIAHVKDGADLARQHHLPEPMIDFIQQHHGTTLVEYFYRRASEQSEADPGGAEVDESSFRYPGPKPQTKESGVLMLADAVESASRVLAEPTPSRIESLVHELTMKRLMDGQFDECGLTLKEVHDIGESLVKSLTAVYHGRVKYPGQQTA
jgi:putative nucleotidyltransferase with HDIG domain